jgi:hypothetical protein
MDDDLELLIRVQEQVIRCRKLAAAIPDPETSQMLRTLADAIEQRAREIDAMG